MFQGMESSSAEKAVQCHSCREYGHIMRDCQKKSTESPREYPGRSRDENMECYNCHETGHRSRDCIMPRNFDRNDGNRSYFGREKNRNRQNWGNDLEINGRGGRRNQRNDGNQYYEYNQSRKYNDDTGHCGERKFHIYSMNTSHKNDNWSKANWRNSKPIRFEKSAEGDDRALTGGFSCSVETKDPVATANLVVHSRNASKESAHSNDNTCDSLDVKENAESARFEMKKVDDDCLEPQSITAHMHNTQVAFSAPVIDKSENFDLPEIFCQNCRTPGRMKKDCLVESPNSLCVSAENDDVKNLFRNMKTTNIVPPPPRYSASTTPVVAPSNNPAPSIHSGQNFSSPSTMLYYEHEHDKIRNVKNQYHGNLAPNLENYRHSNQRRSDGYAIPTQQAQISSLHDEQPYLQRARTPRHNLAPPLSSSASCYAIPTFQEDVPVRNDNQSLMESQVNKQRPLVYLSRMLTTVETQTDPVEIITKENETKVEVNLVIKNDSLKVEIKRTMDVVEKQSTLIELLEQDVNNCFPLGNLLFLNKTVVFVDRKRIADYLVNFLAQNGICAVTAHDELSQIENEKNLNEFFAGIYAVLICPLIFMDDPSFEKRFNEEFSSINVFIYDLPGNLIEIQENLGFGRENLKKIIVFYDDKMDGNCSADLVKVLSQKNEMVPDWLMRISRQHSKNVSNNLQMAPIDNSYSSNIWD